VQFFGIKDFKVMIELCKNKYYCIFDDALVFPAGLVYSQTFSKVLYANFRICFKFYSGFLCIYVLIVVRAFYAL